eukprot:CAMPEP_0119131886 /NCGR_PEP_ID=MMETSP1310-20130426/10845_1 /TAXON_ID=464262 /ORGANISM="Genus nov. species nov., Strain RCC2339" /LENGTH=298 /DNA_ID=CAMNT_0007122483 /DNA_START=176 /DNA_END=1070 /DNA_ORIENTATION=-
MLKLQEVVVHVLVNLADGGQVAAAVAIVGSREDRHCRPLVCPQEPVAHELVGPHDEFEPVGVVELLADVLPKGVPRSTGGDAPAVALIGVAPQEVAHGAFVGHLLEPVQLVDAIYGLQRRAEPRVRAEELALDERRQGQEVEQVRDHLPHVGAAVLPQALIVKAVHLRDLPRLVVSPDDRHPVWVPHLEGEHHLHGLHRVVPAVHVVPQEQEVGVGGAPRDLEQLLQVVELAVTSPTTVTGALTGATFGSCSSTSLHFWHRARTPASGRGLHSISASIWRSRSWASPGSSACGAMAPA